jgi:phosphoribosyl 1,2-cyclic phosphodiesterase
VVVYENIFQSKIDHLNVRDAERIIGALKPRVAVLTHFGMTMLKAKPREVAARIQEKLGVTVIAARDGMELNIDDYYQ